MAVKDQAMQYYAMVKSGMPAAQAYQIAFPNGVPTAEDRAKKEAKEQQKSGLGQIAGMGAGAVGAKIAANIAKGKPAMSGLEGLGKIGGKLTEGLGGIFGGGASSPVGIGPVASGAEYAAALPALASGVGGLAATAPLATSLLAAAPTTAAAAPGLGALAGLGGTGGALTGGYTAGSGGLSSLSGLGGAALPIAALGAPLLMAVMGGMFSKKPPKRQFHADEVLSRPERLEAALPGFGGLDAGIQADIVKRLHDADLLTLPGIGGGEGGRSTRIDPSAVMGEAQAARMQTPYAFSQGMSRAGGIGSSQQVKNYMQERFGDRNKDFLSQDFNQYLDRPGANTAMLNRAISTQNDVRDLLGGAPQITPVAETRPAVGQGLLQAAVPVQQPMQQQQTNLPFDPNHFGFTEEQIAQMSPFFNR